MFCFCITLNLGVLSCYAQVVGNGATWERCEPLTNFKKAKFKKIEFCFLNIVLCSNLS